MKIVENIHDVFKALTHHKPSTIFCPKCGNPNLHLYSGLDLWLTPQKYVCDKCGYVGPIFMELEKEEENKKEN